MQGQQLGGHRVPKTLNLLFASGQTLHLGAPGTLGGGKLEVDIFAFNVSMRHDAVDVPSQGSVASS